MIIYQNKNITLFSSNGQYYAKILNYPEHKDFFDNFFKNENREYTFECELYVDEINTLDYLLKNNKGNKKMFEDLFLCLVEQIKYLETHQLTIPVLNVRDVLYLRIRENYAFYFLNPKKVFSLNNEKIIINKLFDKNDFTSKELNDIEEIPNTSILKTASYWSLGKLLEYCLRTIDIEIEDIKFQQLYWALKKCLELHPKHRYLLFV